MDAQLKSFQEINKKRKSCHLSHVLEFLLPTLTNIVYTHIVSFNNKVHTKITIFRLDDCL